VRNGDLNINFGVLPLEGLWWANDMSDFVNGNKSNWYWTMMIMQPDIVTASLVDDGLTEVLNKKRLPAIEKIRFESLTEGRYAQILHKGPFDDEGPTVEKLHQFIHDSDAKIDGKHHEIYLSDIRRAAPADWKTVLRQPMLAQANEVTEERINA
ncbi:MAG TPA: hypothetical protein EYQ00_11365, partial [Dehalococcoidia bacterium]|nr:hypothetical protein [Dehalococcoidia bacterium]